MVPSWNYCVRWTFCIHTVFLKPSANHWKFSFYVKEKGFYTGATAPGVSWIALGWVGAARVLCPTVIRPPLSRICLFLQPFTSVMFRMKQWINQPTCGHLLSVMYYMLNFFLIIYKSMKHELLSLWRAWWLIWVEPKWPETRSEL